MTEPAAQTTWRPSVPVSLDLALGPLQRGRGDPAHQRESTGAWWRASRTPVGVATLRLAVAGGEVRASAWGHGAAWVIDNVPALLGANDDVAGFAPQHPVIASSWRRLRHLRLGATGTVFELIVPSVIEQRVTGAEAHRSWRDLLRWFGEPAPGPAPAGMRVTPGPDVWSRIPSWDWHRANVDPGRARTVRSAASVAGRLEEAVRLPHDQRMRRLRHVPGIGVWTAAEVAQRAWGDADAVSVGDFHIPSLVGWALVGRPVDDDEMLELLSGYPGHRHRAVRLIEASGVRKPGFGPRMPVGNIREI